MFYGAMCMFVNCIDSVCMESLFVAYIDAYFVLFQNISITLWPEVLFFHFLSFVVQLKGCAHEPFYAERMCDFQNGSHSLAACP